MSKNKLFSVFVICVLVMSQASFAAGGEYGTLKVVTDDENAEIYIDGAMAGYHVVTIEEILVGSHYAAVKLEGKTIFSQMALIQKGKQTTIFARPAGEIKRVSEKASGFEGKSKYPFFYTLTYGSYTEDTRYSSGTSASGTSQHALGLGVGVKFLKEDNKNSYYTAGFHYNAETENVQISYIHLDVGSENETAFSEIGINIPLWKITGLSVNGSLGYQVTVGFHLTDNLKWGIKYAAYNGSGSVLGYSFNTTFTQLMFFVRAQ